jgi:hypothetical protein
MDGGRESDDPTDARVYGAQHVDFGLASAGNVRLISSAKPMVAC